MEFPKTLHSDRKSNRTNNWTFVPSEKAYGSGLEERNFQLHLFLDAAQNGRQPILNPTEITIPPNDSVLIKTISQLFPENYVTGILQLGDLLHEGGDSTFCPALVTLNDGNIQVPVNDFTDHPSRKCFIWTTLPS